MQRNLFKTRRPAPTLHFNLTFQRTGSMLPRLALASLHPHGFSPCLLMSSAVQRAATWLRNWGFPYQIPQVSTQSKRMSCSSSPSPPHTRPAAPALVPACTAQISGVEAQLTPPLCLFVLFSWNLSSTWKPLCCRICSQRRVSFVAALCKIALLGQGYLGEANWNGGQRCCT